MADIRINALATTAASTASDDFIAIDGSANGTRKLDAYSPTFGGNLTVSGGTLAVTPSANDASATLKGRATGTNQLATSSRGSNVTLVNLDTTDNNCEAIAFQNSNELAIASIVAQNVSHTGRTGKLYVNISNGAAPAEALNIAADKTVTLAGNLTVSTGFILNRVNAKGIYTGTSDNCGFTWTGTNGEFSTASGSLILKSAGTTALTLDSSQNATFAGKITANGAGSTFKGTATNDSAAAGYVGEYVSSRGTSVALTSNTNTNVTSISLTAGDWDVEGSILISPSGTLTLVVAGVSSTSATYETTEDGATYLQTTFGAGQSQQLSTGARRYSLSATTTIYLIGKGAFASGTTTANGVIRARRVR